MNECVFSEIILMLGLNIGGGGGFIIVLGKFPHQSFIPTV